MLLQTPTSRRQRQAAGKGNALRCERPTGDSQSIDALDRRDLLVHAGELMGCIRRQSGCCAGTSRQVHLHSNYGSDCWLAALEWLLP